MWPFGASADLGPTLCDGPALNQKDNHLQGKSRAQSLIHRAECKSILHPPAAARLWHISWPSVPPASVHGNEGHGLWSSAT